MSSLSPFISRGLLNDFFRDVNPGYYIKPLHGDALQIKVDVKETPAEYIFEAEIPGASKENINIDILNNVLTISAQINQQDSQTQDEKLLRSERYYGSVSRSFQLGADIDQENSKARYDNGLLVLNLAKKVKPGSQRLNIE